MRALQSASRLAPAARRAASSSARRAYASRGGDMVPSSFRTPVRGRDRAVTLFEELDKVCGVRW